jgi:hypothetical protein
MTQEGGSLCIYQIRGPTWREVTEHDESTLVLVDGQMLQKLAQFWYEQDISTVQQTTSRILRRRQHEIIAAIIYECILTFDTLYICFRCRYIFGTPL